MVWEINMVVCPRLEFDDITQFNWLGYDFYIYGAFEFSWNSIVNLWRHVWYHYHTLKYPVINISTVTGISGNWRINDLITRLINDIAIYHMTSRLGVK